MLEKRLLLAGWVLLGLGTLFPAHARVQDVFETPAIQLEDIIDSKLKSSEKTLIIENIDQDLLMTCFSDRDSGSDPDSWGQIIIPKEGKLVAFFKIDEEYVVGTSPLSEDAFEKIYRSGKHVKFFGVGSTKDETIALHLHKTVPSLGRKVSVDSMSGRQSYYCRLNP